MNKKNSNEPSEQSIIEIQRLLDNKEFDEVSDKLDILIAEFPKSITCNNLLGMLSLHTKKFDDAKNYFDIAYKNGSDLKVYNNNLSIIYSTKGSDLFALEDYSEALNYFLSAIKQGPLNPLINYINVHKCYRKLDDFEAAESIILGEIS